MTGKKGLALPASSVPRAAGPQPPALTAQQRAAIETRDVSIALSAGAGCGKTFVLTRRFLSHVTPGPDALELSELVAITFTERAAREMRDRIRKECRRILENPQTENVDRWLALVRQLDAARISTIHSFCGALLRAHAVEAALDPRFKLLDETTSGTLLRSAVTEGLHALLASGDLDSHELVLEFGLDRAESLLEQLTLERFRIDFREWREKTAAVVASDWEKVWHTEAAPKLLEDLVESPAAKKLLQFLQQHVPDNKVMQERRQTLLDELPALTGSDNPVESLERLRQNARVQGGGTKSAWADEATYEQVKEALTQFRDAVDATIEQWQYNPDDVLPAAEMGLRMLRVVEQVGRVYDEHKRRGAWLDFDDLLLGARDLLRDHPEVRRRAAAGIRLLLVDEFQDTDPIQTDIVRFLCGDDLYSGKLFVVGDVKQSIYRFRRAEPEVFRNLRQQIAEKGRLPLTMNFRSQPAILTFVNALFDGALGDAYEPLVPSCEQISPAPTIEFLFSSAGVEDAEDAGDALNEEPNTGAPRSGTDDKDSAETRRKREAQWIARRLAQLLHDGVPRVRMRNPATGIDELRPVQQKDIVILFRAMTDIRHYEAALRECGLDYYVVGGQAFFAQQEVFDVVNLCRSLDDPDDEVALAGVLRSPFFSLSDDALLALARVKESTESATGQRASLLSALESKPPAYLSEGQQERVSFAARVLGDLRACKNRLSLAQLLTLAVEKTGYDAALLTEFLGARKLANLRKLIDQARQFDRTGLFTLADFVDRLQESVGEETKEPLAATHPESSDVIRLMSIHQSKGLEFPVVVVADMDRKGNDLPPAARFDSRLGSLVALPEKFGVKRENLGLRLLRLSERDENLAETLRLLYVAATRAADHLILSANLKAPGQVSHPWLKLVAERFDLLTGQPRQTPTADDMVPFLKYLDELPEIHVHQKCPAKIAGTKSARQGALDLRRVREVLDAAVAAPLPVTLLPIAVDRSARRSVSVSEIREADARLNQRTALVLDAGDDDSSPHDLAGNDSPPIGRGESAGVHAREVGDIVHLVLERLDLRNPGDPASAVSNVCTTLPFEVGAATRGQAIDCIQTLISSPVMSELTRARRCEREIEFYLPWPIADGGSRAQPRNPSRIITGKLDCLLQTADGDWVVLDYKTGKLPSGKTPGHALVDYEMQLAIYALAVRTLSGKWPIRSQLVLLRDGGNRVGFDANQADWGALEARIDAALREILGPGSAARGIPPDGSPEIVAKLRS